MVRTYNQLERFHRNIKPVTVEKTEVVCLQDIQYEVQILVVMEAALTILIWKDIKNNADLLEDRRDRTAIIERVNNLKKSTYIWLWRVNVQTNSNYTLLDLLSPERLELDREKDKIKEEMLEASLRNEEVANFLQVMLDRKISLTEQRLREKYERWIRQMRN